MQQYDIATKVLIESCRDAIIRYFIGIEIEESLIIEPLPQETVSLKRSDYPVMITDRAGSRKIVLLEIQTRWKRTVPLNLLDYRTRYLIKHDIEVISCVILLCRSSSAANCYSDNEVNFTYRLVKIYELDARAIVSEGPLCLMPFVPLMKCGEEFVNDADMLIYNSELSKTEKADMLTSMAILSGLVSKELPSQLVAKRRDIMIESAAYEIIKQEGFHEGVLQGIQQGIQQGIEVGKYEGIIQGLSEFLSVLLETKFGIKGIRLYGMMKHIRQADKLKEILEVIKLAKTPDEVADFLNRD